MPRPRLHPYLALLAAWLPLSGCLRLGPDFKSPAAPAPIPAGFQHANAQVAAYAAQDQWWREFKKGQVLLGL